MEGRKASSSWKTSFQVSHNPESENTKDFELCERSIDATKIHNLKV